MGTDAPEHSIRRRSAPSATGGTLSGGTKFPPSSQPRRTFVLAMMINKLLGGSSCYVDTQQSPAWSYNWLLSQRLKAARRPSAYLTAGWSHRRGGARPHTSAPGGGTVDGCAVCSAETACSRRSRKTGADHCLSRTTGWRLSAPAADLRSAGPKARPNGARTHCVTEDHHRARRPPRLSAASRLRSKSAPGGTRTRTAPILSRSPLPIGLRGRPSRSRTGPGTTLPNIDALSAPAVRATVRPDPRRFGADHRPASAKRQRRRIAPPVLPSAK